MKSILIFAGTSDGRMLAEALGAAGIPTIVSAATEYGKSLAARSGNVTVMDKHYDLEELSEFIKNECSAVVDATHPYAVRITEKLRTACLGTGIKYLRLMREDSDSIEGDVVAVPDVEAAVNYLKDTEGNIFVTTGSKEISAFAELPDYKERVYARVLSLPQSMELCSSIGLVGKHLICMQGPFSEDLNIGMMRYADAKYLVTKDSGEPGGFEEKLSAAASIGVKVVLITRPTDEKGLTAEEIVKELEHITGTDIPIRRRITLVGIGMGSRLGITGEGKAAIAGADLLVGAERMLRSFGIPGRPQLKEFLPSKAMPFIREHPQFRNIVILMSGDVGFHSGTKSFIDSLSGEPFDITAVPGISSPVYLCSKLGIPWDDVFLMSVHADADANVVGEVRRRPKVFTLLRGSSSLRRICAQLMEFGLQDVTVHVGRNLGGEDESIMGFKPGDAPEFEEEGLYVALMVNPDPVARNPIGIRDELFLRGDAPMTKSEIRSLSVSKLALSDDSVVYDIGAGTGSVSVEMALTAVRGKVYAVEKEKDALELIAKNRNRFAVPNLEIVDGIAPFAMEGLPIPTHAFIGGSSGNLKQILELLLEKNPKVRIAINSITLETVTETLNCIRELDLDEEETVCVTVAKGKRIASYHLMMGANPVYITIINGRKEQQNTIKD